MVDISDIKGKIASIPAKFKHALDYLVGAEGNILERNAKEFDITAPLGIYRYEHPEASVFTYIDSVAKQVTTKPSKEWDHTTIKSIDKLLNKDVCYYLAYIFYSDFYKSAALEYYDEEVTITIISLYANSPKLCNESVQKAINVMGVKNYITLDTGAPIAVDGVIGKGSKSELAEIDALSKDINYAFRLLILLNAKTAYFDLYFNNQNKFGGVIKGWFNRVDRLQSL